MLKRLLFIAVWIVVTSPFVGVLWASVSAFAIGMLYELGRYARDVYRIHRDPLSALSPRDDEIERHLH